MKPSERIAAAAGRSERLQEAAGHIEALLELYAGRNANAEMIVGWCSKCDVSVLHASERCRCVCHPARAFAEAVRKEYAGTDSAQAD